MGEDGRRWQALPRRSASALPPDYPAAQRSIRRDGVKPRREGATAMHTRGTRAPDFIAHKHLIYSDMLVVCGVPSGYAAACRGTTNADNQFVNLVLLLNLLSYHITNSHSLDYQRFNKLPRSGFGAPEALYFR